MDNYIIDDIGIIHQVQHNAFKKDYGVERNNYGEVSNYLSYMRLGFIQGAIETSKEHSILDVGFGNGDFLRACKNHFKVCAGHDLFYDYLPEGTVKQESLFDTFYNVITFFDSLEHFEDINFLDKLQCEYVVISVPNCASYDEEWFMNWKHRRPDEHLHHFNEHSLTRFLTDSGYVVTKVSFFEDSIRKDKNLPNNILTVVAEKL